jgi:hypothetical protein
MEPVGLEPTSLDAPRAALAEVDTCRYRRDVIHVSTTARPKNLRTNGSYL